MSTKPNRAEKEFGERVAIKRKKLGLTQLQLSKKLKVSRETIANIERGHQRTMLAHALKLRQLIKVKI